MTRSILITGAGAGIGRATARRFLAEGWEVTLLGRRRAALEETAEGHSARILIADVGDPDAVEAAFAELPRLDVLFNNAGISAPAAPIDDIPVETWLEVSRTNITGMFLCARAAFGLMRRQSPRGGRIINNGSISAHVPRPGSAPYTMSKHAVTGLTRTLGLDGRAFDIACAQIDIGNALTDMAAAFTTGVPQASGETRVEPVMDVAHVAAMVLHMASLPPEVNTPFVTIMARDMPYIGRG
ncbi:MAG: SDR family oxidoreductase [Tabrizicola sp.]|jgi:NAD(P)-dependent dehydrogenase (short-subunit alcohol dehydrogenase family)|uniref:SDR family oxidoreductase n=1 Tax=Tabrizicola sp. TaxID=2005166 RepID=UPI001B5CB9FC|nr:SDR family oxidoreductase [Tabrizicola sp.]MCC6519701.1 SDR family oxidoreductase [Tabrizicola sp.]